MIDKRVGSLEVGKDADIVVSTGSIIDPRCYVTQVLIDGKFAYDIKKDRPLDSNGYLACFTEVWDVA